MTNIILNLPFHRIVLAVLACAGLGVLAPGAQAQNPARELSAAEIRNSVIGRTFDIAFTRDSGERVDAVITIGADGRWHGNNRFTPARQDGTATNVFDGQHRMRGNRLCQQHWVVARNGQAQSPGGRSTEACYRLFLFEGRLVFYAEATGTQTYWTPRN